MDRTAGRAYPPGDDRGSDISCLGVSNRRTSPISAAKVTAMRNEAPRHRLVGFHDRLHRPLRHDESELLLEATQALKSILDRVDPFLKDDYAARHVRTSGWASQRR